MLNGDIAASRHVKRTAAGPPREGRAGGFDTHISKGDILCILQDHRAVIIIINPGSVGAKTAISPEKERIGSTGTGDAANAHLLIIIAAVDVDGGFAFDAIRHQVVRRFLNSNVIATGRANCISTAHSRATKDMLTVKNAKAKQYQPGIPAHRTKYMGGSTHERQAYKLILSNMQFTK
jgi:hypothetical protein